MESVKKWLAERQKKNGIYIHSNPPKLFGAVSSIELRHWARTGAEGKLERAILAGQGRRLLAEAEALPLSKHLYNLILKCDALQNAVEKGSLLELKEALDRDYNRNKHVACCDDAGVGLLHKAIYYNYLDIAEYLVTNYPQLVHQRDSEGRTPLHYTAACREEAAAAGLLQRAGAGRGARDAAGHTLAYYRADRTRLLLPVRDNMPTQPPGLVVKRHNIRIWCHECDMGRLQRVVWEGQGARLLSEVSSQPVVKRFLEAVPYIMNTIRDIHEAVVQNNLESVIKLTSDPVPPLILSSKDANNMTAMHKAAGLGHNGILKYIIERYPQGIQDIDNEGRTPLHYAAGVRDDQHTYNTLVSSGADESVVDNKNKTPAYYVNKSTDIDKNNFKTLPEAPRTPSSAYPPSWDWKILDVDFIGDFNKKYRKKNLKASNENISSKTNTNTISENTESQISGMKSSSTHEIISNLPDLDDNENPNPINGNETQENENDNKNENENENDKVNEEDENEEIIQSNNVTENGKDTDDVHEENNDIDVGNDETLENEQNDNESKDDNEPENNNLNEITNVESNENDIPISSPEHNNADQNHDREEVNSDNDEQENVEEEKPEEVLNDEVDANVNQVESETNDDNDGKLDTPENIDENLQNIENETADETADETVEETADETVDEIADKTSDHVEDDPENITETKQNINDETNDQTNAEDDIVNDKDNEDNEEESNDLLDEGNKSNDHNEDDDDVQVPGSPHSEHNTSPITSALSRETNGSAKRGEINASSGNLTNERNIQDNLIEGIISSEAEQETLDASILLKNGSITEDILIVDNEIDPEVTDLINTANMEMLATLVLNGEGSRLIGRYSGNQELQAFLNNVPTYMQKINRVHIAARDGNLKDLQAALDRRKFAIARDSISPNGATPLHVATIFGKTNILKYLGGRFPETLSAVDFEGRTALHYAAVLPDNGHYYNLLQQLGANSKDLDDIGQSADNYYRNPTLLPINQLLADFGVSENMAKKIFSDKVPEDRVSSRRTLDIPEALETLERCYRLLASARPLRTPLSASSNKATPPNVLGRFLKKQIFDSIKFRTTKLDHDLFDVIWPAVKKLPDSRNIVQTVEEDFPGGVTAPDYYVYDVFPEFLFPLIKDLHNLNVHTELPEHPASSFINISSDRDLSKPIVEINVDPSEQFVLSGSIECSRNLKGIELPINLKIGKLETIERVVTGIILKDEFTKVIEQLNPESDQKGGSYYTLNEVLEKPSEVCALLASSGLLIALCDRDEIDDSARLHGKHWPYGRGVYVSDDKTVAIWINVHDHIRVITSTPIDTPGEIGIPFSKMTYIMSYLHERLEFMWHPRLGHLSSRPTFLGAGIRFSLIINFSGLSKDSDNIKNLCAMRGLQYRESLSTNISRISNFQCLYITELNCFNDFTTAASNLLHMERELSMQNTAHITTMFTNIFKRKRSSLVDIDGPEEHSHQSNGRPPNGHTDTPMFHTEEGRYLAKSLGDPLIKGLTEVANVKPKDPIAFLATFLHNFPDHEKPRLGTQESKTFLTKGGPEIENDNPPPETEQTKMMFEESAMQRRVRSASRTATVPHRPIEVVTVEPNASSPDAPEAAYSSANRDEHGQSMLHFAAARAHSNNALLQILQESDVSLGYRDELYRTARDISIQANVLDNTAQIDKYVLQLAARGNTDKIMELLLLGYDHILDVVDEQGVNIKEVIAQRGDNEMSNLLASIPTFEESREAVHGAVRSGDLNRVKDLVSGEGGGTLVRAHNLLGRTVLHTAVLAQDEDIVAYLAENFPELLRIGDNLERTPLHYAMGVDKMESLSHILIKAGAKRVLKDLKGRQPSYYFMNKSEILRLKEEEEAY